MTDLILPVVQILAILLLAYLAAWAYYSRLPSKTSEPYSWVTCTATDTKYTYRESQGGWLPTDPAPCDDCQHWMEHHAHAPKLAKGDPK